MPEHSREQIYSLIIAVYPESEVSENESIEEKSADWRLGEIHVDWVDFTREKSLDKQLEEGLTMTDNGTSRPSRGSGESSKRRGTSAKMIPGSSSSRGQSTLNASNSSRKKSTSTPDDLSLQPLLAHCPGPNPLETSVASGVTNVGRGVVHLFRHAPPASLIASLDSHPLGESSRSVNADGGSGPWAGTKAEGEDGSLIAILAVPAWMRPADFLEFIGGWGTCLEGVRMIREATTPNRSIVLLKFRDPLQASDFLVIFTGRAFSTLDARETCHPIRIHHLVLHKMEESRSTRASSPKSTQIAIPAFPPSVYSSRARDLPELLTGVNASQRYELPSCPVCLERLDSTVTGLVTLPCAHTFDCDCLKKWGDSRCPVCRVSHLLLSNTGHHPPSSTGSNTGRGEIMRLTKCSMCDSTEKNWICVVCGVVGCGRYEPGKGHARRHYGESGHQLAMEIETQRVWDYKGDNYVHRLIQTRMDGKLVELPSASSLVTSSMSRPMPLGQHTAFSTPNASPPRVSSDPMNSLSRNRIPDDAGPSSNDIDKISTIEAITLEYSYLLSSQLEAMRQHYEEEFATQRAKLKDMEAAEARAIEAETARKEAEKTREKAERKAEKASELARALQGTLSAEKAMSEGLSARINKLKEEYQKAEEEKKDKEEEVKMLEETVRDLMFSLEAGASIKNAGGADAGEGGDLVVVPGQEKKKKGRR